MSIGPFVHRQLPVTIVFGIGERRRVAAHLEELEPRRALIVHGGSGAELAGQLDAQLGGRSVGSFSEVVQHVPAALAEAAIERALAAGVDVVVAIGGGSAIGYAKAIARRTQARIAAVPTTYSGSEMTPIWGLTAGGRKTTGRDPLAMPRLVMYDPELTITLPAMASAASGFNALAHAVDGLYAPGSSPLIGTIAVNAIELMVTALPAIARNPGDLGAREQACFAGHLAGTVSGIVEMALHHRVCHVLGGAFSLPHALTHAVILPHSVAFNQQAAPAATAKVARALGTTDAAGGLWRLARELGLPAGLAELGMRAADLQAAAEEVAGRPGFNPTPVTPGGVARLLGDAFAGQAPGH